MIPLVVTAALSLATLGAAPAVSHPAAAPDGVTVSPATVTAPAKVDLARDATKVTCVSEPVTGSRFVRRVCMTREQRAERDRQMAAYQRQIDTAVGMKPLGSPIGSN